MIPSRAHAESGLSAFILPSLPHALRRPKLKCVSATHASPDKTPVPPPPTPSAISRRVFLTLAAASVATASTTTATPHSFFPFSAQAADSATIFELPPLPYSYEALEPKISSKIMRAHHDTHFKTYVDKLNASLSKLPPAQVPKTDSALRSLLASLDSIQDTALRTAVRNNGGGYLNHKLFFQLMSPTPQPLPSDSALAIAIRKQFGSFDAFQTKFLFSAASLFGSGFTWLVKNKDDSLQVIQTPNQDNPCMTSQTPVLACDCWEHSWYYQYGPAKKDYFVAWWDLIDWSTVNDVFLRA